MHPLAAFIIGLSVMGVFYSAVQKSPTKEEIAYALSQRDQALQVVFERLKKLEKVKK